MLEEHIFAIAKQLEPDKASTMICGWGSQMRSLGLITVLSWFSRLMTITSSPLIKFISSHNASWSLAHSDRRAQAGSLKDPAGTKAAGYDVSWRNLQKHLQEW